MKNALLFSVCALLVFSSCEKSKEARAKAIIETAEDNSTMSAEYNAIFDMSDNVSRDEDLNNLIAGKGNGKQPFTSKANNYLPDCATATYDSASTTLSIDYGTTNCLCKDGRYRKGVVTLTYEGQYLDSGSVVKLSVYDYYVQDIKFNGTKTITNLGNASGSYRFAYEVKNASAETEKGTISWETNAEITKTKGNDTPFWPFDDEYIVTGTSRGTNRNGVDYRVETTVPLKKRNEFNIACLKHYVSGVLRLEDDDDNFILIDYDPVGGEPCDLVARININGDYEENFYLN
tara:strand:+ start:10636 stop:11505 length:870 start_codon:yes stop_codon:yes gene_type:complete